MLNVLQSIETTIVRTIKVICWHNKYNNIAFMQDRKTIFDCSKWQHYFLPIGENKKHLCILKNMNDMNILKMDGFWYVV